MDGVFKQHFVEMFLTVYFSMDLCLFLHVLPSEVFRTTRAATRVQPAIRAFHCNRVISPSLQSGWSRLGRLGRSLKGSREPRHSKENEEDENRKTILKISPQLFLLKGFFVFCWCTWAIGPEFQHLLAKFPSRFHRVDFSKYLILHSQPDNSIYIDLDCINHPGSRLSDRIWCPSFSIQPLADDKLPVPVPMACPARYRR